MDLKATSYRLPVALTAMPAFIMYLEASAITYSDP
jgi:hypothetical protein